jgi:hypothetical protein
MSEAIRTHRAVFAMVNCEHICMGNAYLDKVLRGLELPRRAPDPDPKTPASAPPPPTIAVAPGSVTRGALTASDALMRDGSRFDDYAIDLVQGQSVTLDLRGGRTTGYLCHALDVQLRALDGERVLADDDDGGGGLASRSRVSAPRRAVAPTPLPTSSCPTNGPGPDGNHRSALDGPKVPRPSCAFAR